MRSAYSAYQARLEAEKIEDEKKREQAKQKSDEEDRMKREKERMVEKRKSLAKEEEDLSQEEKAAMSALKEAEELLSDATKKLHSAINEPSMNQQSVKVASTMLDVANSKREKAMQSLQQIHTKQSMLDCKKMQLLDKALPLKKDDVKRKPEPESSKTKKKK